LKQISQFSIISINCIDPQGMMNPIISS